MQEDQEKLSRNDAWTLVTRPDHTNVKTVVLEHVETEKWRATFSLKPYIFVKFDSLRKTLGICII